MCRRYHPEECPVNKKLEYHLYLKCRRHEVRSRQLARAKLEKLGLVKKGDGKQVHHVDGNPMNNKLKTCRYSHTVSIENWKTGNAGTKALGRFREGRRG
jgi:hypothetical protein